MGSFLSSSTTLPSKPDTSEGPQMQRHAAPGTYVLLRRMGVPPWPALVCPDDMAPPKVTGKIPMTFNTLLLLITKKPEFVYATTSDMIEYDPFGAVQEGNPELQHAYNAVLEEMDSPASTLEYWTAVTEQQHKSGPDSGYLPSPSTSSEPDPKEESDDEYLQEAIRLSLAEVRVNTHKRPSDTSFPPKQMKRARVVSASCSTPRPGDIRTHFTPMPRYDAEGLEITGSTSTRRKPENRDYVDGDLAKSTEMVKIHVGEGEQEQEFLVPKAEIEKRPSLSHAQIGCMTTAEDGTPQLDLPCFRQFDPEDFRYVAEFLSTGTFGHTSVDESNRDDVFVECAAAWPIADRLVLEDFLDLIVVKVRQTRPWHFEESWALAKIVYQEEGSALDAYVAMKEMLAESIAENFYTMALQLGAEFLGPLQQLPELRRDVHKRLFDNAQSQLDAN
ncbi:hypothetical protein BU23DRAFT_498278 [Bimuria novae-zelandiae CBS 107.79]|uniref:PWWP domain-containing protein n=1 Tax=Bimuria novae-zelandiae CBS 107.79 TaxID=1447943 RepID=A0A6A5VP54_9PLEO|nr:hypothetical protein BU23DRAFT_498278 [Bimuria novae-zelandiae CBS 107.79]